jgi:iron complex transport system ATP-binding protein
MRADRLPGDDADAIEVPGVAITDSTNVTDVITAGSAGARHVAREGSDIDGGPTGRLVNARPAETVLEIANATVVKNGVTVLDRLTLRIDAGEHTAILGPNGAGKTTLINLLTRDDYALARPGAAPPVRIFGSATWDLFDLRSKLGIVSADLHQQFVAGNSLGQICGEDAVVSGFFATKGFLLYASVTDELRARALDALRRFDAEELARKPLSEMSTGEARRVLIARALVTGPQALVLDEPTAGLDMVARRRFLESVRRLAGQGTTIVLVTHHVEEIVPEIGRVILLQRGRIAADGTKEALLTTARLTATFDAAVAVHRSDGWYSAGAVDGGR